MKGFIGGLVLGVVICGIAWFMIMPGMKETSYKSGYDNGNKVGVTTGTAAGIAQAVAEAAEKRTEDSLAVEKKKMEASARAARKPRKVAPPVQNWHVINGKIGDPILPEQQQVP
jgi:preprotein translocase subunit YajC